MILHRIAHDGRFSLKLPGPGFRHAPAVLSSAAAREAVIDYLHQLDMRNVPELLDDMSRLSVLMLCGAHKMGSPAFDLHLSWTPSLVYSLRVLLHECREQHHSLLIRGTWLLLILSYITQLRPRLDESLVLPCPAAEHQFSWDALLQPFYLRSETLDGRYSDWYFLRVLRSLRSLNQFSRAEDSLYLCAAWKLDSQWQGWAGMGIPGEPSLNIRL